MSKRSSSSSFGTQVRNALLALIGLLIAAGAYYFTQKTGIVIPGLTDTTTVSVTTSSNGGSSSGGSFSSGGKQAPQEITFHNCPPEGDGGDPVLNRNKNRVDQGNYQPMSFSTLLSLTWPKETERTDHASWSSSAAAQIAQYEGLPVAVEGYLAEAREEGPESPNCHSSTDHDYHIWLLGQPGGPNNRNKAVVVEATPRVRTNHPGWTVARLNDLASSQTKVRISGWVMFDPEHPEQLQNTRGTLWEIHPIMQIDVFQNGQWVNLDNFR